MNFNANFRKFPSLIISAFLVYEPCPAGPLPCKKKSLGSNGYVLDLMLDILKQFFVEFYT